MSVDRSATLTPFGLLVHAPSPGTALADLPVEPLRRAVLQARLLVLRGFAPFADREALAGYCRAWGDLLEWDFGSVFEVVEQDIELLRSYDNDEVIIPDGPVLYEEKELEEAEPKVEPAPAPPAEEPKVDVKPAKKKSKKAKKPKATK